VVCTKTEDDCKNSTQIASVVSLHTCRSYRYQPWSYASSLGTLQLRVVCVCVCVCVLSHWVYTAMCEGPNLPTLKYSSHWSLGLHLASVDCSICCCQPSCSSPCSSHRSAVWYEASVMDLHTCRHVVVNHGACSFTSTPRYLRDEWRFSEDLAKYIVFAIANVDARCPAREALAHARRFFSSLGHYGKTPYIYPLYGAGEVPQVCVKIILLTCSLSLSLSLSLSPPPPFRVFCIIVCSSF
jgi:hypothetical protein